MSIGARPVSRAALLAAAVACASCSSSSESFDGGAADARASDGAPAGDHGDGPGEAGPIADQQLPGCAPPRTSCGGQCVDLAGNPAHCGTCDHACDTGQVCDAGKCTTVSNCRQEGCVGFSYCDLSDGRCKPGCAVDGQCGPNEACDLVTNTCVCVAGYHDCLDVCVSDSSAAHCGQRCSPCPTTPNGTAVCKAGACAIECNSGYTLCGGACASCPTGAHIASYGCSGTACTISSCDKGYHVCGSACYKDSDPDHCGTACAKCPSYGAWSTPVCFNGSCGAVLREDQQRTFATCDAFCKDASLKCNGWYDDWKQHDCYGTSGGCAGYADTYGMNNRKQRLTCDEYIPLSKKFYYSGSQTWVSMSWKYTECYCEP